MPVYRPVPQPLQGPKIAPFITGVSISAEGRLNAGSAINGLTAVAKVAQSQLFFQSREAGLTAVSKPSDSRLISSSTVVGLGGITRLADGSRLNFRSVLRGLGLSTTSFPDVLFEHELSLDNAGWVNNRSLNASWESLIRSDDASWQRSLSVKLSDINMTRTGVRIDPVVIGDDFRVRRTYTGLPTGTVITTAWFTVKTSESVPDGSALIQKVITTSATSNGQITDADTADGILEMFFDPNRTETALALAQDYVYDIQVKSSSGQIYTLEKGTIPFILGVTAAT